MNKISHPSKIAECSGGFGKSFYKCHPKTECKTVVRIIYDNVYDLSEFESKENISFLSKVLMICPEHISKDLTSNTDASVLSDEERKIISQIKLSKENEIKKQICENILNKTGKNNLNQTIYDTDSEVEKLTIENRLLKDLNIDLKTLNSETKEKNELLRDKYKLNSIPTNTVMKNSCAFVTANEKPKPKRIPKLVIKKTNDEKTLDEVSKSVTRLWSSYADQRNQIISLIKELIKEKSIRTKQIITRDQENDIIINCVIDECVEKTLTPLNNKIINLGTIEKEKIENPKTKLMGIDNLNNMDMNSIEKDINHRNFSNFQNI